MEFPTGKFRSTPALVPIHSRSLQANNEVIRRQADLCCRMISSQVDNILFTGLLTSISKRSSWLERRDLLEMRGLFEKSATHPVEW